MSGLKMGPDRVPNAPLREAFLRSGITANEVAGRIGWSRLMQGTMRADGSKVRRLLGLKTSITTNRGGSRRYEDRQVTINVTLAQLICDAIDVEFDALYPEMQPRRPRGGKCADCRTSLLRPVADQLCGFCREEREQSAAA